MTEILLNGIWLSVAAAAMLLVPRRSIKATIALGCVLALLFPIISVSDDFSADRALERAALAVVSVLLLAFAALVPLGRLERRRERLALIHVATPSDPRSPPRG